MNDEGESAKTAAKDAVQRKIGRNLLLYQQIEGHLKFVLANARASGTLNELAQFREDRSRKITKQMLGLLVDPLGLIPICVPALCKPRTPPQIETPTHVLPG